MITIKKTTATKDTLKTLEETSALTWEGLVSDEGCLMDVANWLASHSALRTEEVEFFIASGALMNITYGLHGSNAYANDLTIVSVNSDCYDPMKIAIPRFEVGGRWFDDIVDNNRRREEGDE